MGGTAGNPAETPGQGADTFEDWSNDEVHQQYARLHQCTAYQPACVWLPAGRAAGLPGITACLSGLPHLQGNTGLSAMMAGWVAVAGSAVLSP